MDHQKKIFINASTVLISGGLILTQNILIELQKESTFELYVICPNKKKYSPYINSKTTIKVVPKFLLRRINRLLLDYIWIPKLIRRIKPHLVLSLGNLPSITKYKQLYLHDNPYLTEQFYKFSMSYFTSIVHYLRNKETFSRIKYVNHIIVQTEYQKNKLNIIDKNILITILSPSIPTFPILLKETQYGNLSKGKINVLCLSRYYEHKNLEKLVDVSKLIKKKQLGYTIYLTIDSKNHKKAKKILETIKENSLENILVNLGKINHDNVPEIMKHMDAIIVPSFLESFSLVFIEAWLHKKPLFVSDIESIRSACNKAAFYFNPNSEESILNTLINAFENSEQLSEIVKQGEKRLGELNEWNDYIKIVKKTLE